MVFISKIQEMNKLLDKYLKKNYNRIVTHDYQLHNFMVKYINIASVLGTKTLYLANLRKLGEVRQLFNGISPF